MTIEHDSGAIAPQFDPSRKYVRVRQLRGDLQVWKRCDSNLQLFEQFSDRSPVGSIVAESEQFITLATGHRISVFPS